MKAARRRLKSLELKAKKVSPRPKLIDESMFIDEDADRKISNKFYSRFK